MCVSPNCNPYLIKVRANLLPDERLPTPGLHPMNIYMYICVHVYRYEVSFETVPGAGEKILSNLNCERFRESTQSLDRYLIADSDTRFLNWEPFVPDLL